MASGEGAALEFADMGGRLGAVGLPKGMVFIILKDILFCVNVF
jgi:hypothetical protein